MPVEATVCGAPGAGSGALEIFDTGFDETEPVTSLGGAGVELKGLLTSKRPESEQPATPIVITAMAAARAQYRAAGDTTDADIRLLTHYANSQGFE
jgi:hypothetical protein